MGIKFKLFRKCKQYQNWIRCLNIVDAKKLQSFYWKIRFEYSNWKVCLYRLKLVLKCQQQKKAV